MNAVVPQSGADAATSRLDPDDAIGHTALRKAAWRLLPLLALGYAIAYMDRVNIGFASLQMNEDLHFSATVYGLGGGLFFLSYALLEVPSNLMLVRFGARRWLARIMVTWGVLAIGMMFVQTPVQFYVMRFLLGAAEAGFFPGVLFYLTEWFPASYRGRAITRFYVAFPLSSVFMGAIAGTLLSLQGLWGLAGWQWLFLIEGVPAVALSAVIFWCLPNGPSEAAWLTVAERQWISDQLSAERGGWTRRGIADSLRTLRDRRVCQLGIANLCIMAASYAAILSAPLVIRDVTGWTTDNIGFLVALAYAFGAVSMIFNGWHSDRRRERYLHTVLPLLGIGVAYLAIGTAQATSVVVAAFAMSVVFTTAVQATFWLIPSDTFVGPLADVGVAAIGSIGMLGAFVGPYVFGVITDLTGTYEAGLLLVSALYVIAAAIVLYTRRHAIAATPAAFRAAVEITPV